jgi:hypothetical protein
MRRLLGSLSRKKEAVVDLLELCWYLLTPP